MPAVARLHRHTVRASLPFVPDLHTPDDDARFFAETLFTRTDIWLAEDAAGEIAGYVAFRPDFVEHLFVRPEFQQQGLGLALLRKAMEGASELSLWTFQQNARARRFYERYGFAVVMETDGADNEEKLPDVLYRWRRGE